ncbi:hypothetical protein [Telluribacter humicola]|uniref:hypothetical protein n=1 Tax=Telluribacter humicola TaxID=1720261 RepID=UPI001A96C039|nr:hypothetical protein [Telluribacter humicola]
MLLLTLSTGTYILFSFAGYCLYVFLYLSYLGLPSHRQGNLEQRPEVGGFDSMRSGNAPLSPEDRDWLQMRPHMHQPESEAPFFDHEATFPGPVATATVPVPRHTSVDAGSEEIAPEEEENDWPVLPLRSL